MALAVLAIITAILNIKLQIDVLTRRKMLYDCKLLFAEYTISVVILSAIIKNAAGEIIALMLIAVAIAIWLFALYYHSVENMHYARVFGIRTKMHSKLSEKLESECAEHGLPSSSVYIYGGDRQSPCNMIIFKGVKPEIRQEITDKLNEFLIKYSYGFAKKRVRAIIMNLLAIFVIITLLL